MEDDAAQAIDLNDRIMFHEDGSITYKNTGSYGSDNWKTGYHPAGFCTYSGNQILLDGKVWFTSQSNGQALSEHLDYGCTYHLVQ